MENAIPGTIEIDAPRPALMPRAWRAPYAGKPGMRTDGPTCMQVACERAVLAACAAAFGVPAAELARPRAVGGRAALRARMAAYLLLDALLAAPSTRIGALLERDHSTVLYGLGAAARRLDTDPAFAASIAKAGGVACAALGLPQTRVPVPGVPGDDVPPVPVAKVRQPAVAKPAPVAPPPPIDVFAGVSFEDHPASQARRHSATHRPRSVQSVFARAVRVEMPRAAQQGAARR